MWNETAARRAYYAYGVDLIRTAGLLLQTTPSVIYRASILLQEFERLVDVRTRSCYTRASNTEESTNDVFANNTHNINECDNNYKPINNYNKSSKQKTKERRETKYDTHDLHSTSHIRSKKQTTFTKPKTEAVDMDDVFGSEVAYEEANQFHIIDLSESSATSASASSSLSSESDSLASESELREQELENDSKWDLEEQDEEQKEMQKQQTTFASAVSLSSSSLMSMSPLSAKNEVECVNANIRYSSAEDANSHNHSVSTNNETEHEHEQKKEITYKYNNRNFSEKSRSRCKKHWSVEYYLPNHVNERMPTGIVPLIDLFAPLDYCVMHYRTNDDIIYLAAACLLVATKMEDSGVRISSIVTAFFRLSTRRDELYTVNNDFISTFDSNTINSNSNNLLCKPPQHKLDDFESCVIDAEEVLLHMIGFQTFVEAPYKYLILYFHTLIEYVNRNIEGDDKSTMFNKESGEEGTKEHWLTREMCLDWLSRAVSWCNDIPRCHRLCTLPASTLAVYALHWSCPVEVTELLPHWTEAFGVTVDMLDTVTEIYKSYLSSIVLPASLELDAICNVMPPPSYCTMAEKEAKSLQMLQDVQKEAKERTTSNRSPREPEEVNTDTVITNTVNVKTNEEVDNSNVKAFETHEQENKITGMNTSNTESTNDKTSIIEITETIAMTTTTTTTTTTTAMDKKGESNDVPETRIEQTVTATSLANVTDAAVSCNDASPIIKTENNVSDEDKAKRNNIIGNSTTTTATTINFSLNVNVTRELEFEDIREMRKRLRREEKERIRREHENAKKARDTSLSIHDHHNSSDANKVAASLTTTDVSVHNDSKGNSNVSRTNSYNMEERVESNENVHEKWESSRTINKMEHRPVPHEREERNEERDVKLKSTEKENYKEMNVSHKLHNDKKDEPYEHHDEHRRHRKHREEHHRREHHKHHRSRSRSLSHDDKGMKKYESSYRHNRHDDRAEYDTNARKRYREDSYDNKYSRYDNRRGGEGDSNRPKRYDIHREQNDERRRR